MGCHTEGMKTLEDQVRPVIEQNRNPSYDKAQALRLYVEKSKMDSLIREDIARYRQAIEAADGVFGGSEPIQQLVKQFEGPLDATHAATEAGLETLDFLKKISVNRVLQDAGLMVLSVPKGSVKRDTWESQFGTVILALDLGGDHANLYADMVLIPAGEFQMGSNDGDGDEKPLHTVYIDGFYIDKYEVTNAQYKEFIDANPQWRKDRIPSKYHNGNYLKYWSGNQYPKDKGNHPVVYVSWYGAMAYAKWTGKRLPTEAEWEKAARARLPNQNYPWGNSISPSEGNYGENVGGTVFVDSYSANGYGLYNMAGNVWEWCLDEYDSDFYSRSRHNNPISSKNLTSTINNFKNIKTFRALRGGSWMSHIWNMRVANRGRLSPTESNRDVGFRCVRSLTR